MAVPPHTVINRYSFIQDGTEITYAIYRVTESPSTLFGALGDVATDDNTVWFRGHLEWIMASKEVDSIGRPVQCHPQYKSKRRLDGLTWKATTTWNKMSKKRKLDEKDSMYVISREMSFCHPAATHPSVLINPQNGWIMDLYTLWTSFPITAIIPVQSVGTAILLHLAQDSRIFIPKPMDETIAIFIERSEGSKSPSLPNIITDLMASDSPNVWDFVNQYGDPEAKCSEVVASMVLALAGGAWKDTSRLYGALSIESTEHGLDTCRLKAHPYNSRNSSLVRECWTSTWTPPGAISHVHMDYYGSLQYFIHVKGKKLWLLWPPTAHNLSCYSTLHKQRPTDGRTLDCICKMEGLQLLYLNDEETIFVLKPNTLHACLSLTQCAHSGVTVWDYEFFDHSFSMMEWGLRWITGPALSNQPSAVFEQEVYELRYEFSQWEILLKQNRKDSCTQVMRKKLKALKNRLDEVAG